MNVPIQDKLKIFCACLSCGGGTGELNSHARYISGGYFKQAYTAAVGEWDKILVEEEEVRKNLRTGVDNVGSMFAGLNVDD